MSSTIMSMLESIIGTYNHSINIADWEWILSACFLLLVVWGCIIIVRSVISRV